MSWALPAKASPGNIYSKTLPKMNTLATITILDTSREHAEQAYKAAFARMDTLIGIFDRFQPESKLSQLNRHGILKDAPPQLVHVLASCSELYQMSQGCFDITILPLLKATKKSVRGTGRSLSFSERKELEPLIGFQRLEFSQDWIRLQHPGMAVTLDGIAKGYIVDQAVSVLVNHGIQSGLINAGGDIRVIGAKKDGPWKIGIRDPICPNCQSMQIGLSQSAVATSGGYEQFYDPRKRHHHLMTTSGRSPHRTLSTTVVAQTAMQADGLATALFLLPPEEGLQTARSLPGVQAMIITRGNRIMTTPDWNRLRL
jgi:thiamine biosynthesis lipoprotein